MPVRARRRPPPQGMAPEAVTDARARTTQATRKGWPYYIRSCRPPARGGPTLHDAFVPLVEGAYIVGPPLAGGLPAAASGPARRCVVACSLRGGLPAAASGPAPCLVASSLRLACPLRGGLPPSCRPAPCLVACSWRVACRVRVACSLRGGLPAAASGPARRRVGTCVALARASGNASGFIPWRLALHLYLLIF